MPYRLTGLWLAVLGLLLIGLLLVLRIDPAKAGRQRPLWRRKLIAAGLALLATLGLPSGCQKPTSPATNKATTSSSPLAAFVLGLSEEERDIVLGESAEWKHLDGAMDAAERIAGALPAEAEAGHRAAQELSKAEKDIVHLRRKGLLSEKEANCLESSIRRLRGHLVSDRTHIAASGPDELGLRVAAYIKEANQLREAVPSLGRINLSIRLLKAIDSLEAVLENLRKAEHENLARDWSRPSLETFNVVVKGIDELDSAKKLVDASFSCYLPRDIYGRQHDAIAKLPDRLALLRRFVQEGQIGEDTAKAVYALARNEVANLSDEAIARMPKDEQEKARSVRQQALTELGKLQSSLGSVTTDQAQ